MRRTTIACVAALSAATASWAGEPDAAAKKRVLDLVLQLESKSDAARAKAEASLAGIGADALPTAVAAADMLKSDDAWTSLAHAVAAMGEGALDAVEKMRSVWPKGTEGRFETLERGVRASLDAALLDAVPAAPNDVAAMIDGLERGLVAHGRFDYGDPKIAAIAALGRPALGELVRILRDFYGEEERTAHVVAKLAFAKIATKDDVPLVAALVRSGHAEAAFALRDVRTPEASAVVADAVRRGLDNDLCFMIQSRGVDETVGRALAAFIAAPPVEDVNLVGIAALAAGRAGAPEAVPAVQSFLAKTADPRARTRCFVALARLGVADGIDGLVATLEKPPDAEFAHMAGVALNETAHRGTYKGGFDAAAKTWHGNFDEAAKAYRAWWDSVKAKAKFDAATRKWTY